MDAFFSKSDLKEALVKNFQLSGNDLEATVTFVEKNVVEFSQSLKGLAGKENWDELCYGGERCKALGDNIGWAALAETGLRLAAAAKAKDHIGVAQAGKRLEGLVTQVRSDPSATAPTIRFKLD